MIFVNINPKGSEGFVGYSFLFSLFKRNLNIKFLRSFFYNAIADRYMAFYYFLLLGHHMALGLRIASSSSKAFDGNSTDK